jgi:hypothetical protein
MGKHQTNLKMKNHLKPVDGLTMTKWATMKIGKRGSMVEVLTPEQLVEALMPWDEKQLFVCVRDKQGRVLQIAQIVEYFRNNPCKGRSEI